MAGPNLNIDIPKQLPRRRLIVWNFAKSNELPFLVMLFSKFLTVSHFSWGINPFVVPRASEARGYMYPLSPMVPTLMICMFGFE